MSRMKKEENIGNLESLAAQRKARLMELKKKKLKSLKSDSNNDVKEINNGDFENNEELPTTLVLFRNYQPNAEDLEKTVLPQIEPENLEGLIKDQLQHSETREQIAEVEMSNLAPKKITYDLRRGIQAKLDKLEKKTDKSIAELIRERLKEGKQLDIIIGAKLQEKECYASDED